MGGVWHRKFKVLKWMVESKQRNKCLELHFLCHTPPVDEGILFPFSVISKKFGGNSGI